MGRLCLRYRKLEAIKYYSNPGQSPESMHYQAEPGNEKTLSGRGTVSRVSRDAPAIWMMLNVAVSPIPNSYQAVSRQFSSHSPQ
jgi:hypothetical protein